MRESANVFRWPALHAALARRDAPLNWFVRDDDAGWANERLFALLDAMRSADAPIDLAVIPLALDAALADALCARTDASQGRIGVHQHGHAHFDHEGASEPGRKTRKSEFGSARSLEARLADLRAGRLRLQRAFGRRLDDIFTPPWNRCAPDLPPQLPALGFALLSRDASAAAQPALPELPVQVDWCRHWRGAGGDAGAALGAIDAALARAVDSDPAALGLMLHHAVMDDVEIVQVRQLMRQLTSTRLAAAQRVRVRPMRALLPDAVRVAAVRNRPLPAL
ncbi:MAG: hypothetical protein U1E89_12720 [Burkholderiaceae bacterium]